MGVVFEDTFLFNDTVRNNIAFAKPDADQATVERAARLAGAHEFILQIQNGYDAIVGDAGCNLSGGQKQRISIARAVLRNAPILLLDEATSALDTETERIIQNAIHELSEGRTVIAIAHRLSTIEHADRIVVIDHGRIAEQGTHAELLARGGLYTRLHQSDAQPT